MRLFQYGKDGGPESTVWGWFLIEFKSLFSIVLLCFEDGSREAYHNHAFNCYSWVLKGKLEENILEDASKNIYTPSLKPIHTKRDTFHKVVSTGRTWVLTFRGPWSKTWKEFIPETGEYKNLTYGRKEID